MIPFPDGNIVDILSMMSAVAAVAVCAYRASQTSSTACDNTPSFEARIVANAACASSIPPYLWMIGAVGWQSMLPTLLEASKLSLGLAGLTSLTFAINELMR
jgi:hypothetical protein